MPPKISGHLLGEIVRMLRDHRKVDQIVKALRDRGKEVEYLLFDDEGHGFARPENRLKFYAAAEKFLAQHLGGRAE